MAAIWRELEDLAFKFLESDAYASLTRPKEPWLEAGLEGYLGSRGRFRMYKRE
jgi:hypothetical protein